MMELLALSKTQTEEFFKEKEDEGDPVEGMTKKNCARKLRTVKKVHSSATGKKQEEKRSAEEHQKLRTVKLKIRIDKEKEPAQILKNALTDDISDENNDVLQKVIETLSTSSEAEKQEDVPA